MTGHPIAAAPFFQGTLSSARDLTLNRFEYEGELKFFLFAVKDTVGDGEEMARENAVGAYEGSSGPLADTLIAGGVKPETVPAILTGVIPLARAAVRKVQDCYDAAVCAKETSSLFAALKTCTTGISSDDDGVFGDAEDSALKRSFKRSSMRLGYNLVKTGAATAAAKGLALVSGVNFQNYYSVSIVAENAENSLRPTFRTYLNYLTLFEWDMLGDAGPVNVKPMMSWGVEWDITEAVRSGASALKGSLPTCAVAESTTAEARKGPSVCGLPKLFDDSGIKSDRCNMCVALTSQLFSTSGANIQSFQTFCRAGCEDGVDTNVCLDVGNRIEVLVYTNRKKMGTGTNYANTKARFRDTGITEFFRMKCSDQNTEGEIAECAGEHFCKSFFIGCLDNTDTV